MKTHRPLPDKMNIAGRRFGKWLVLRYVGIKGCARYFYCRCDCGVEREIPYSNLIKRLTTRCQSCGKTTHGKAKTASYKYWFHCKTRLNLCDEWSNSYEVFAATIPERKPGFALVAANESLPIGPGNYQFVPGDKRRLELMGAHAKKQNIGGVEMTARELQAVLGVSRQRSFQIINTINGKCRCGGLRDREGKTLCSKCQGNQVIAKLDARIDATKKKLLRLQNIKREAKK